MSVSDRSHGTKLGRAFLSEISMTSRKHHPHLPFQRATPTPAHLTAPYISLLRDTSIQITGRKSISRLTCLDITATEPEKKHSLSFQQSDRRLRITYQGNTITADICSAAMILACPAWKKSHYSSFQVTRSRPSGHRAAVPAQYKEEEDQDGGDR